MPVLISCGVGAEVLYSEQLMSLGTLPGWRSRLQTAVTSKPTTMYMLPSGSCSPKLFAAAAAAELAAAEALEFARKEFQPSSLRAPPCTCTNHQLLQSYAEIVVVVGAHLHDRRSLNLGHVLLSPCVLAIGPVIEDGEGQVVVHVELAVHFIAQLKARADALWGVRQVVGCDWQVVQDQSHSVTLRDLLFEVLQQLR